MPILLTYEKLILFRRRRHWSQAEAAVHFSVSRAVYQRWEHGDQLGPRVKVTNVKPLELYYLFRTRKGWSQRELANRIKCSRQWVRQMEAGESPHTKLANFWNRYYGHKG